MLEKCTCVFVCEKIYVFSCKREFLAKEKFSFLYSCFSDIVRLRTKRLLESSGCRTRPLKPSDINLGSLKWVKIKMHVSSELMVQIRTNRAYGVETPFSNSFLGGFTFLSHHMQEKRKERHISTFSLQHVPLFCKRNLYIMQEKRK